MEKAQERLKDFYRKALTVNADHRPTQVLEEILADDFVSRGSEDAKTKTQLIGQLEYFWSLVPDLKWEPQEMIHQGNKFVVRSIASGSPKGDFMGVPADGSKSFKIMTIDVHTFENNQIKEVYHLEDWGTAVNQLKK